MEGRVIFNKCEDYGQEFISSGNKGFFVFHPLVSFSFEVSFESVGSEDSSLSHVPNYSSYVSISSFGYSGFSFEFSGLKYYWVHSAEGSEFFNISYIFESFCFSKKYSSREFSYAFDRGNYFYFIPKKFFSPFHEFFSKNFKFFLKVKEHSYSAFKDYFSFFIINTYSSVSDFLDVFGCNTYFPSSFFGDFTENFSYFFLGFNSCDSCRGDIEEKFKHSLGKDVIFIKEFFKNVKDECFNSVFNFSDFLRDFFSFSCEEFEGFRNFFNFDYILIFEHEESNSFSVDSISFCSSYGLGFVEIFKDDRVKEGGFKGVRYEKGEDVNVIGTAGFNTYDVFFFISYSFKGIFEFNKSFIGVGKFTFFNDFTFVIYYTEVKFFKGYINACEVFKHFYYFMVSEGIEPLKYENWGLPLLSSRLTGSDISRNNQLIEDWGSRGLTPVGAFRPYKMWPPLPNSFTPHQGNLNKNIYVKFNINLT